MSTDFNEAFVYKLFHAPHQGTVNYVEHLAEVDARAADWAHYHARDYDFGMWTLMLRHQDMISELARNAWDIERRLFITDDPGEHQARFVTTYVATTVAEAKDILQNPRLK